jgi:hypothetical protein
MNAIRLLWDELRFINKYGLLGPKHLPIIKWGKHFNFSKCGSF